MAGPWDNMTKRMIKANPEHFVNWLAAGTTFVTSLDNELKRFNMFQDILRESWVYQEIGQEFLEQGFEKGLEQGLTKGLAKGLEQGLEQGLAKGLEQGLEMGREEERRRRIQDHRQLILNL